MFSAGSTCGTNCINTTSIFDKNNDGGTLSVPSYCQRGNCKGRSVVKITLGSFLASKMPSLTSMSPCNPVVPGVLSAAELRCTHVGMEAFATPTRHLACGEIEHG